MTILIFRTKYMLRILLITLVLMIGVLIVGLAYELLWYLEGPHMEVEEYEDRTVADELAKKVRVLCWVMTEPDNHEKRARHVKATWGQRCNVLLFTSSVEDKSLPAVNLTVNKNETYHWAMTKAAFEYIYEHHRRDADWFIKADDETFVAVENLRYMLAEHDASSPIYFGYKLYNNIDHNPSGGLGYMLSRKALDMFVEVALQTPALCEVDEHRAVDLEMGKCLEKIGAQTMAFAPTTMTGESTGSLGVIPCRLSPFIMLGDLVPTLMYYNAKEGPKCSSEYAITYHKIDSENMYLLNYLIYHLRPFGYKFTNSMLRNRTPAELGMEIRTTVSFSN